MAGQVKFGVYYDVDSTRKDLLAKMKVLEEQIASASTIETYLATVMAMGQLIAAVGQGLHDSAREHLQTVINNKARAIPQKMHKTPNKNA